MKAQVERTNAAELGFAPLSVTKREILVIPCAAKNSLYRLKNPIVVRAFSSSRASV